MKYEERLLAAETRFTNHINNVRAETALLAAQRHHPLQDDWDDALNIASDNLYLAELHLESARRALKEGS